MSLFYIDPGTGSLLVSTLIGVTITMIFSLRGLFYRLFSRITGRNVGITNDFTGRLVFFNEGRNYWNVFKPVLDELIKEDISFVYLSADKDDPGLLVLEGTCGDAYCTKSIQQSLVMLNRLKADMVVMTTPQLDVLHLKRSSNVRHYCHLLHSPDAIHTYKKFAFDCFDSVLCSSSFHIENLRQLEQDRNFGAKKLLETGCTYYDLSDDTISLTEGDAVLLAPTWGDKSFFKEYGEQVIKDILDSGELLIFRPHPQSWISESDLMDCVVDRFKSNPRFIVDKSPDNSESLKRAKVMICDFSGVIYDFSFLRKKPVIGVYRDWLDGGYESSDIINPNSALKLLEDVGRAIRPGQLGDICRILQDSSDKLIDQKLIDKHVFNFGHAGEIAAKQIVKLFKGESA